MHVYIWDAHSNVWIKFMNLLPVLVCSNFNWSPYFHISPLMLSFHDLCALISPPLWWFTHLKVHALIGIRCLTHNRVPHNKHEMRITQATSNPLEYLLALHRGKVKNLSQSPRSEPETITFLRSMILAAPSCLGGGNHQKKQANPAAKHSHQMLVDAITQAMHSDSLSISQRWWINDRDELEGFGLP
jgi:hypothetical protein